MGAFEQELLRRLESLEQEKLRRRLRKVSSPQAPGITIDGCGVLNFSSNDYLGLAIHPRLKEAASRAARDFGTGSGASRLICGSLEAHERLEQSLAEFKGAEAALVFTSGYATALGTITALVSKGDFIVLDKLVHASIVDAAKLSGAKMRIFAHNDLSDLEDILRWCDRERTLNSGARMLIVTESLFSMDGDFAPLPEIVRLKETYGAWLMVDEAHATGLFGATRRGLIESAGLSGLVEIQMGTLGKALGVSGGFIAGSSPLREYLLNKARSFIFSTAPSPPVSAAAAEAIDLIRSPEGGILLQKLRENLRQFHSQAGVPAAGEDSPIVPLVVGAEGAALHFAEELWSSGFFVPAIRFPTVARGKARLRFTFSAAHTAGQIQNLSTKLRSLLTDAEPQDAAPA